MSGVTRHSKEAVRLCEHIVKQSFGNVVHRIASLLLRRGRLGLLELARLSGLPPRTAAAAVIILMQHSLVTTSCLYLTTNPTPDASEDGVYEFNETECLNRLRFGRILGITENLPALKRHPDAVDIVQRMMVHGRMTAGMLKRQFEDAENTLVVLVQESLIVPTAKSLQITHADEVAQAVKLKRSNLEGKADTKRILSAAELARIDRDSHEAVDDARKALRHKDRVLIAKKAKKDRPTEYSLRPDIPLCINHDRYGILIRDQILVEAARDHWNEGAAEIFRAVLAASLDDESTLADPRTNTAVSVTRVQEHVRKGPKLVNNIRTVVNGSRSKVSEEMLTSEYLAIMSGADQMIDNGTAFLSKQSAGSNPTYYVEIERICVQLRANVLKDIVHERVGAEARRVLSVVMEARLASEQTVRDCALLPFKEARKHLSTLQGLSLIETQDVPKTLQKQRANAGPAPEFHYWGIDLARAYNGLLSILYKTIGNAYERKEKEIASKAGVLAKEKVQKRDKLQAKDQNDLIELDKAIEKLDTVVSRSAATMFILRDMPGWPSK